MKILNLDLLPTMSSVAKATKAAKKSSTSATTVGFKVPEVPCCPAGTLVLIKAAKPSPVTGSPVCEPLPFQISSSANFCACFPNSEAKNSSKAAGKPSDFKFEIDKLNSVSLNAS